MPLLAFDEALARTLRGATRLGVERLPLAEADGRVLAADRVADRAMPEFAHSAMDGYAVALEGLAGDGPWSLPVVGESRAGATAPALVPGTACRIFTGGGVPAGANAVIMQEAVSREGDRIAIAPTSRPRPDQNIRPRGEDLAEGTVAIPAGTRLRPALLGLAAALDCAFLEVARAPRVTFLATGDELRAPGSPARPGSIPESNAYVLGAVARRNGAIAHVAPFVGDDPHALESALARGLENTDLLVTIGGASVGDHDLVRPSLEALGGRFDFWGVSMRPGKPTAFGSCSGTRVLCLPGNPASATLAFLLFGVPLLRALQGARDPSPRPERMRVLGRHTRSLGGRCDGRDDFLRATLEWHDGVPCARLARRQSSGAVTSFASADVLVVLSGMKERIEDGEVLPVLRLADFGA